MLAAPQAAGIAEEPRLWPCQVAASHRNFPRTPEDRRQGAVSNARGHCNPSIRWFFAWSIATICLSPEHLSPGRPRALFNPFPGLRPFEPDEDHLFFGREKQIDELLRRLRGSRFLAVVGSSGSGKSSLIKSGLIPSLYSGFMAKAGSTWRVSIF